ncbi:MAG TPA: hypothetical protein VF746_25125 [Longimicrobium sp.]|jgi:hypothetical protein
MRIETRSALILLATLALGVLLGAVGGGALASRRAEKIRELRRPPGFVAHLEEVIRPRDEAQRRAIRPHLEATARRNHEIVQGAHGRLRAELDSLRARLAPLLDEAQRERLAEFGRPPERGGGPPPGGLPPPKGPPPRDGRPPRDGPPPPGGRPR